MTFKVVFFRRSGKNLMMLLKKLASTVTKAHWRAVVLGATFDDAALFINFIEVVLTIRDTFQLYQSDEGYSRGKIG